MLLKILLIWSPGGPPDHWSGTIYAILEEGSMGNTRNSHLKLFQIWTSGSGSGDDV